MPVLPPKPHRDFRPWGEEIWITDQSPRMVKIISVEPEQALSLQFHNNRDEYWRILSGNGTAQIGEERFPLKPGDDYFIPRTTVHRLEGGTTKLVLLELSFGEFEENDIVRLEDRYGRAVQH